MSVSALGVCRQDSHGHHRGQAVAARSLDQDHLAAVHCLRASTAVATATSHTIVHSKHLTGNCMPRRRSQHRYTQDPDRSTHLARSRRQKPVLRAGRCIASEEGVSAPGVGDGP